MYVIDNRKDPKKQKWLNTRRSRNQLRPQWFNNRGVDGRQFSENGLPFIEKADGTRDYYPEGFDRDPESREVKALRLKMKYQNASEA